MEEEPPGAPLEWDEAKSEACRAERGFGFEIVRDFDFASAATVPDTRRDYGEPRFRSFGPIGGVLHSVVWTPRDGAVRIISVRRANARERKRHG